MYILRGDKQEQRSVHNATPHVLPSSLYAWCGDMHGWHLLLCRVSLISAAVVQGVTHISAMTKYPKDSSDDTHATWVAHFAHPLEFEWVAKQAPAAGKWPTLLLQVCYMGLA